MLLFFFVWTYGWVAETLFPLLYLTLAFGNRQLSNFERSGTIIPSVPATDEEPVLFRVARLLTEVTRQFQRFDQGLNHIPDIRSSSGAKEVESAEQVEASENNGEEKGEEIREEKIEEKGEEKDIETMVSETRAKLSPDISTSELNETFEELLRIARQGLNRGSDHQIIIGEMMDVIGNESRTAKVFRVIQQNIIFEAIYRLKLSVTGEFMTKDVRGAEGWQIAINMTDAIQGVYTFFFQML